MARSRNIKPGFFKNEELAELGIEAMLLFAGLWTLADREGRLEDRPKRIRAEVFPYFDAVNVEGLLVLLAEKHFILRYRADDKDCISICAWHRHQNPHHMEVPSAIPAPEGEENKYNHTPITKSQRQRIFLRDHHKCIACGATKKLSIDHIVPVSKGGTSEDSNLRTLCEQCNYKKGDRLDIDSSTSRARPVDESTKVPVVPLIPDSLIPDSLIPCAGARPPAPVLQFRPSDTDYQQRFEQLYARHPIPGFKQDGIYRYLDIISSSVNADIVANAIDRDHAEWCKFWAENPTEYRPGIGKFFEDGYHLRKPRSRDPTKAGVQQKTKQQQQADDWANA